MEIKYLMRQKNYIIKKMWFSHLERIKDNKQVTNLSKKLDVQEKFKRNTKEKKALMQYN